MPARGRGRKSKSGVCRSTPACNQREIAEKEATPEEEPTIHAQNDLEGGHIEDDTQSVQSDFASTDAPKASKKSKPVIDFSPEEEQSMIEWLEANPVLYNKKLNLYKDTAKKEKLWGDKAVELGKSVDVLKIWYSSLRSRYGKLKKLRSGSGDGELTERDDWVLRNFEFLRPHIYEVQKKTNVSVDILVNNAGRSQRAEWIKTSLEVDQQVLNVNVLGVLSLTKLVLPYMIKRNEGHIVNMSSIAGKIGAPFSGSYTGAKHAIQGWFDALRIEVLENNIAVTNLCPGPVFSNLLDIAFVGEAGKVLKQKMEPTDKRMKTTRCAELSAIAIANKLDECWIALNPVLFLTYANQYSPVLGKFVGKKFGLKIMKRLREGR